MSEQYYDEVIAPALKDIAVKCKENGMPFIAAVQYDSEDWASTISGNDEMTLAMYMIATLLRTAPNIDAFLIALLKHCRKNGISLDQSMFLRKFME